MPYPNWANPKVAILNSLEFFQLWNFKLAIKDCVINAGSISILLFLKFLTNKCSLLSWNIPRNKKKTDALITLINQSQEIRPQGLDLGRSTSIRSQIKTLRPYFSIFNITVVRICLRKQQSKFFTNMLSTPSIEPANIWFNSASPWPILATI